MRASLYYFGNLYAPSFDHAIKDLVADEISILPRSRVVILEGLYLSLDREQWSSGCWSYR